MEAVVIERGKRRAFASVLAWPGWARSGKSEELAIEALFSYQDRYEAVARQAGLSLPAPSGFEVVERLEGDATTDFGAPHKVAARERLADAEGDGEKRAKLLTASWAYLDKVVAGAPKELRKGPRGGGRDRDAIVRHVTDAELAYGRKIGVRVKGDLAAARAAILQVLSETHGAFGEHADGWPPSYAARRIIWHVLDHAWEIEDKSSY